MAGRRWAQGSGPQAPEGKARLRPSERAGAGETSAAPPKARRNAQAFSNRTVTADGKPVKPSPEAMAAARAILDPPKAPWHPLPLAEIGIVLGAVAMLVSVVLRNYEGGAAGFTLILLSTFEFSWREHRHGYRSHATVLAGTPALFAGIIAWRFLGANRPVSLGVALVVFLLGWGMFDRAYVPARQRQAVEPGDDHSATARDASA